VPDYFTVDRNDNIDDTTTTGTKCRIGLHGDMHLPPALSGFAAGLGDTKITTTLCPGGKERMRCLMDVVASGHVDLRPMVTHRFKLDQIDAAYELFSHQRDGVLKVAITI
jgi:threonine dehydrogenase-like Zn-dependent dehydrogenase